MTRLIEDFAIFGCATCPTAAGLETLAALHVKRSREWEHVRSRRPQRCPTKTITPHNNQPGTIMEKTMARLLRQPAIERAARVLVTLPFWASGLAKISAFNEGVAEMARAGLEPPVFFNILTIVTQIVGSALIITGRRAWIGAGALGVFTALTILLVHRFWTMTQEPFATIALHISTEHIGMIGGLLAIAILSTRAPSSSTLEQEQEPRSVWQP